MLRLGFRRAPRVCAMALAAHLKNLTGDVLLMLRA